jgi:hypothetical protein
VLAVKVALEPAHTAVALAVIEAVGKLFTVTVVAADVVEHPVLFVTVTV